MRFVTLLAAVIFPLIVHGQPTPTTPVTSFPSRPLRLLVPAPAGGGADLLARTLAAHLSERRGWNVIVENKPGAGGNIAGQEVARSIPDGYTLLLGDSGQLAINGALYTSIPFDALRDFTPITQLASFPIIMVLAATVPATNVAELIALARKSPGKLSYASTGIGTPQHLAGHLFVQQAGIDVIHVPFKGGAPALTALLGGEPQVAFIGVPPTLPHVRSGKLRALAITTKARTPLLPDVPTMSESGFGNYEASVWFGLVGPTALPSPVVQTLNAAFREALTDAAVQKKLADSGLTPEPGTPEGLAQFMRVETAKWGALVKATGARAD